MSDPFIRFWFRGLQGALSHLDQQSMDTLMTHCGQACSDSYSKQVFRDAYHAADTLDGFLDEPNRRFDDAVFRRVDQDTVEVVYTRCGCDLARDEYLLDPALCRCSLKSLQYNLDTVLGAGSAECSLERSILGGADCCRFLVKIQAGMIK